MSSLYPFLLCNILFLPWHINISNSSTQDAGNQALLLPSSAWQHMYPVPTGLWVEKLVNSSSTGTESRDSARIQSWQKNPWHARNIMTRLTAQSFAALVRRSTSAFESSDRELWTSSKGHKSSRFHKCTVCINNTSSKDLIRKIQFIKRAAISFFNYIFFSYARIARQRLGCISEPSTLCCSVKHPSVVEGMALVKKLGLKEMLENMLWSFWAITVHANGLITDLEQNGKS